MKHVALLIPEGDSSLSNLEATYKMFSMTNGFLEKAGKQPLFKVQLVGASLTSRLSNGMFSISPNVTIADVAKADLVVIPAVHGDMKQVIANNQDLLPWLQQQYRQGAEIASLCIGAFLLASTGLLTGKSCATHWLAAAEFRSMFPDVNLVDDKIITDEQGLYTSGGAYSSLNLNLYLLEKFAGREMAVLASKIFEIDIERNSQSPFIIFRGQKDHSDEAVKQAQEFMEQHYQERITVDELADMIGVGRRSFERRFKKATGNTVVEYLQRVKIEAAKKQLESGRKTISEVMYDTCYSDTKAFRDVFRKYTGMTPIDYRNKYSKEAA
ncbi:GlxA family transcriptional regulator [Pontibacter sp. 13R65]|uniref:GlxA family transcriptional regulator n=1 Tax=Pontibacter sp. 13R65 TaxID=3127458 RepID=UPI00301CB963